MVRHLPMGERYPAELTREGKRNTMANESVKGGEQSPGPLRGKGGILLPVVLALMGSGLGGGMGAVMLGPPVGKWLVEREGGAGREGGRGGHGGGHGGAAAPILHVLENLVVNPAGSEGTRYLLISVALQPTDPKLVPQLAALDIPFRHSLLAYLGSKTVAELADIAGREVIVAEISALLEEIAGPGIISRIYLPQYVLQ